MSLFTEKERADLCYMHDNNPGALFDATVAAVLEKLTAGVSVEPVGFVHSGELQMIELGYAHVYPKQQQGAQQPLYTATAIAAARVAENERCVSTLGSLWHSEDDSTRKCIAAIRALVGAKHNKPCGNFDCPECYDQSSPIISKDSWDNACNGLGGNHG